MNKRELEIKDIACYLPYDMKVYDEEQDSKTDEIVGVYRGTFDFANWSPMYSMIRDYKPVLRPMIDLTKEITIDGYNDGKPFVPAKLLYNGNISIEDGEIYLKTTTFGGHIAKHMFAVDAMLMNYKQIELLNQWHFDYKGLIDEGLAIDINTIN